MNRMPGVLLRSSGLGGACAMSWKDSSFDGGEVFQPGLISWQVASVR